MPCEPAGSRSTPSTTSPCSTWTGWSTSAAPPSPGRREALRKADAAGMRLAYVTNNAFRTPAAVAALLTSLGVPAAARRRGDLRPGRGPAAGRASSRRVRRSWSSAAAACGWRCGNAACARSARRRTSRARSSRATRPTSATRCWPRAASRSAAGALFVASNGDLTIPGRRGIAPGNGSLIQVIATATGVRPLVAGKPEPPLHRESVLRTGARHPLVVGDRLDTDIEGAHRVGTDSLLVLTGVTGPADVVLAPPSQRPTYLAEDLAGLLEPHPETEEEGRRLRLRRLDRAPGRRPPGTDRPGRAHRRPARTVRRRLGGRRREPDAQEHSAGEHSAGDTRERRRTQRDAVRAAVERLGRDR